jgi:hypothetical protein
VRLACAAEIATTAHSVWVTVVRTVQGAEATDQVDICCCTKHVWRDAVAHHSTEAAPCRMPHRVRRRPAQPAMRTLTRPGSSKSRALGRALFLSFFRTLTRKQHAAALMRRANRLRAQDTREPMPSQAAGCIPRSRVARPPAFAQAPTLSVSHSRALPSAGTVLSAVPWMSSTSGSSAAAEGSSRRATCAAQAAITRSRPRHDRVTTASRPSAKARPWQLSSQARTDRRARAGADLKRAELVVRGLRGAAAAAGVVARSVLRAASEQPCLLGVTIVGRGRRRAGRGAGRAWRGAGGAGPRRQQRAAAWRAVTRKRGLGRGTGVLRQSAWQPESGRPCERREALCGGSPGGAHLVWEMAACASTTGCAPPPLTRTCACAAGPCQSGGAGPAGPLGEAGRERRADGGGSSGVEMLKMRCGRWVGWGAVRQVT